MITECIILAGGLGTRLRSVVADLPKTLAPIGEHPFLHYLFLYLQKQGIKKIILSVGYKHESIDDYVKQSQAPFEIVYAVEETPLGTGGAIHLALKQCSTNNILIINGDTIFNIDISTLNNFHELHSEATLTMALKQMENFDRYGTVMIDESYAITGFEEKQAKITGLINGGIYILNKALFTELTYPEKFSFETDFLNTHYNFLHFYGYPMQDYFIDIGIPTDFEIAQKALPELFSVK